MSLLVFFLDVLFIVAITMLSDDYAFSFSVYFSPMKNLSFFSISRKQCSYLKCMPFLSRKTIHLVNGPQHNFHFCENKFMHEEKKSFFDFISSGWFTLFISIRFTHCNFIIVCSHIMNADMWCINQLNTHRIWNYIRTWFLSNSNTFNITRCKFSLIEGMIDLRL